MKQCNSEATAKLNVKQNWYTRAIVWAALVGIVVVWQIFIPKTKVDTVLGQITLSWNGISRALFPISPWVGIYASIGGQINNFSRVLANPLYLLTPTIYASFGILFNRLSKRIGRSYYKDILLIFSFGFIHGLIATLNSALTYELAGIGFSVSAKKFADLTIALIALRSAANGAIYLAAYPLVRFLDYLFGKQDPFSPLWIKQK